MVEAEEKLEFPAGWWRTSAAVILVAGAFLRLYDLDLVPLHHDEGVNGHFLVNLVRHGFYEYNPENYHGPTLYYFSAVIPWISRLLFGNSVGEVYGLTIFTIRFVTAAFGVATIWLILSLRQRIGSTGAIAAAALLAVSPGAIYISRYFIHEMLLVFFKLAAVIAVLKFHESARSGYLLLAAGLAALIFATKETAIISAGVLLIALVSTQLYVRPREVFERRKEDKLEFKDIASMKTLRFVIERFGGPTSIAILSTAALSLFITVTLLFYSSFFTNYPKGLHDALKTYQFWTRTGTQVHVRPWHTYLDWMWRQESTLLLLGMAGVGLALWRVKNAFVVFTALWGFGMFAAYSLIPYKTPWLMLNFVVPLSITAGYAIEEIYRRTKKTKLVPITLTVAITAVGWSTYQAIKLNFFHYDRPSYVYPYARTYREFLPILEEINRAATLAGTNEQTPIAVTSPEYWPLPWYLRNYPHVKFHGQLVPSADPIVIALAGQEPQLRWLLGAQYVIIKSNSTPMGTFPLRPGIELILLVRADLVPR